MTPVSLIIYDWSYPNIPYELTQICETKSVATYRPSLKDCDGLLLSIVISKPVNFTVEFF